MQSRKYILLLGIIGLVIFSGCIAKKGIVKPGLIKEQEAALVLFKQGAELLYKDNEAALGKFDQVSKIDPNFIPSYFNAGLALEELGNLSEAKKRYEICLSVKKDQPNCLINLLLIMSKSNEVDKARELLNKYLLDYPESSWVKSAASYLYFMQKDLVNAEKSAREAIELNAEDIDALFIMARIFFAQKKYAAAKWVIKNALEIMPSHGGLYLWLGHVDKISGLNHDALDAYAMAVKYQPTIEALESYGLLLLRQGKSSLALNILEKLAQITPTEYKSHLHLGNALIANKKYEEANKEYLKALELNPNDKDIYFNLGILYYDQNPQNTPELSRLKTAQAYFNDYLIQPNLSKDKINEVKDYLDKILQKIELEEYKKETEAEPVNEVDDKPISEDLKENINSNKKELKNLNELEEKNVKEENKSLKDSEEKLQEDVLE